MLRKLVTPLVQDLRDHGLLARHFFIRYWQGGPHIRCRLLPVDDGGAANILSTVRDRSNQFFGAHSSADQLEPDAYEEMVRMLARAEPDAEYLPLQHNNSLQFIDYRPEHHKYGTGMAIEAVERHFEQSSDLVLDVICREVPPTRGKVLAFAALVAGAASGLTEIDRLVEGLEWGRQAWGAIAGLLGSGEDKRVAKTYSERRDQLRAVVLSMWRNPWSTTGDTFVDGWRRSVSELWNTLAALETLGEFATSGWATSRWAALSEHPATTFAVDNCSHMVCNRLGIPLPEEWFLRSLAARTVADLSDDLRLAPASCPN